MRACASLSDVGGLGDIDGSDWDLVYRVALRVLKSPDLAADAAQDALLRAHAGRDRYHIANKQAWLRRVSYTCAIGYLRSPWHRRRDGSDAAVTLDRTAAAQPAPDDEVSARLLSACLDGCLDALRDSERWLFEERYLRGASVTDIASATGVSSNTAKQRVFRARKRVQECVQDAGCAAPADGGEPLAERRCRPCAGGIPAMTRDQIERLLPALGGGWHVVDDHHLARDFDFHDFVEAMEFARAAGELAEAEGHHPSLTVEWGSVRVVVFTRKVDGLTEADFVLAAKLGQLRAPG